MITSCSPETHRRSSHPSTCDGGGGGGGGDRRRRHGHGHDGCVGGMDFLHVRDHCLVSSVSLRFDKFGSDLCEDFVGIGGAGMSGIAEVLINQGYAVDFEGYTNKGHAWAVNGCCMKRMLEYIARKHHVKILYPAVVISWVEVRGFLRCS